MGLERGATEWQAEMIAITLYHSPKTGLLLFLFPQIEDRDFETNHDLANDDDNEVGDGDVEAAEDDEEYLEDESGEPIEEIEVSITKNIDLVSENLTCADFGHSIAESTICLKFG